MDNFKKGLSRNFGTNPNKGSGSQCNGCPKNHQWFKKLLKRRSMGISYG
jgi:hypothetical protein